MMAMISAMNRKMRGEQPDDLDVERGQLGEVMHLEIEMMLADQRLQPCARRCQVLGALELQHDAG